MAGAATDSRLEKLSRYLQAGTFSEGEIRESLGLTAQEFAQLRRSCEAEAVDRFVGTSEQTYGAYCLLKFGLIRDIDSILSRALDAGDQRSALQALKTKGDQFDGLVKTAQTLGLVEKAPSKSESVSLIAQLSDPALLDEVGRLRTQLRKLTEAQPDAEFLSLPLPKVYTTVEGKEEPAATAAPGAPQQVQRKKVTAGGTE
jgi:hypothetical protein